MKKTAIVLAAAAASLAIPVFATTQTESPIIHSASLLPNQVAFLKTIDNEAGTNISSLKEDPTAIMLVQASARVCGNTELQKKTIRALGGTQADANYASNKFQTLFCNNSL